MKRSCSICGIRWNLHVDHDHTTGAFRGFLCSTCNTGLGKFRDDPFMLQRAIAYLEDPPNAARGFTMAEARALLHGTPGTCGECGRRTVLDATCGACIVEGASA